jgi:hypothetical protein
VNDAAGKYVKLPRIIKQQGNVFKQCHPCAETGRIYQGELRVAAPILVLLSFCELENHQNMAYVNIPKSPNTVRVSIIDTTGELSIPADLFVMPRIGGAEHLKINIFSFLVKHPASGRQVIFDLGLRKDFENLPQHYMDRFKTSFKMHVEKDVADILTENGVALDSVEGIIWRLF